MEPTKEDPDWRFENPEATLAQAELQPASLKERLLRSLSRLFSSKPYACYEEYRAAQKQVNRDREQVLSESRRVSPM